MTTNTSERQQIWSRAARDGAVLGAVSVAAGLLATAVPAVAGAGAVASMAGVIIWAAKTAGSYILLKRQIASRPVSGSPFRYGLKVVLFSSILYSAYIAADLTYISPDRIKESFDLIYSMYNGLLDSNSMQSLEAIEDRMPLYATISQFIWCYLFGTVFSSIISSGLRRKESPFGEDSDNGNNGI